MTPSTLASPRLAIAVRAIATLVLIALSAGSAAAATGKSWTAYAKEAREEVRMGNYNEAEILYLKSLAAAEKADGTIGGNLRGQTALRNLQHLVDLYRENKQTDDFIRVSEAVLKAELRIVGVSSAEIQSQLGKVYLLDGQLEPAAQHLEAALETLETAAERDEEEILDTLSQLGRLKQRQEKYDEAERYYQRSLDLAESLDPRSRTTALAINDLAWFYVEQGREQEALPFARAAYDRYQAIAGSPLEEAQVADTLGLALFNLGRQSESLEIYRKALNEYDDADRMRKIDVELTEVYQSFVAVLEANGNDLEAERVEVRLSRAMDRQDRFDQIMTESTGKTRKQQRRGGAIEPPADSLE